MTRHSSRAAETGGHEFLAHERTLRRRRAEPAVFKSPPNIISIKVLTRTEHGYYFLFEATDGSELFRSHSIFCDFLRSLHHKEATIAENVVLERSEQWNCGRDELEEAIGCALRAGARKDTVALLKDFAARRLQGEGKAFLYTEWVEKLKDAGIGPLAVVNRSYCLSLVCSGRWWDALELLWSGEVAADPEIKDFIAAFNDDRRLHRA